MTPDEQRAEAELDAALEERARNLIMLLQAQDAGWACCLDSKSTILSITAALRDEREAGRSVAFREASQLVSFYNLDHDHGARATKACDDLEELLLQQAIREQARREGEDNHV